MIKLLRIFDISVGEIISLDNFLLADDEIVSYNHFGFDSSSETK